jgi:hypothetical protein
MVWHWCGVVGLHNSPGVEEGIVVGTIVCF